MIPNLVDLGGDIASGICFRNSAGGRWILFFVLTGDGAMRKFAIGSFLDFWLGAGIPRAGSAAKLCLARFSYRWGITGNKKIR